MTDQQSGPPPPPPPWKRIAWVAPALVSVMVGVLVVGTLNSTSPAANSSPTAAPTPPCTARDVTVESNLEGATGSLAGEIVVRNGGPAACVLIGPPLNVELRSEHRVLGVALTTYASLSGDHPVAAPPVLLEPGQKAQSFVIWSNWCGGGLRSLEMLVVLQDGSGPIVTEPEPIPATESATTPRCDAPAAPSGLGVFAFAPFRG